MSEKIATREAYGKALVELANRTRMSSCWMPILSLIHI